MRRAGNQKITGIYYEKLLYKSKRLFVFTSYGYKYIRPS